jgi:hypothetical protein
LSVTVYWNCPEKLPICSYAIYSNSRYVYSNA